MRSNSTPSKRDWIRRHVFRRSPSPLSTRRPATPPTTVIPSSASRTKTGSSVLADALELLTNEQRQTIRAHLPRPIITVDDAADEVYGVAYSLQRECAGKRWHWAYNGREISLQAQADKVLQLLAKFQSVGDVIANVEPVHIGLPWAGIRTILQVALSDNQQRAALLTGTELSLYVSNRLKVYLDYYAHLPSSTATDNFRKALVDLYAHVLGFLALAIHIYQRSSAARMVQAVWDAGSLAKFEVQCDRLCARAGEEASNCDRQVARQRKEELDARLESLCEIHSIQSTLTKVQDKVDLTRLEVAGDATYNSFAEGGLARCLPGTRTDILAQVAVWSSAPNSKMIFWLCGKAGTGKSTISRTVAQNLEEDGLLGASFFFKRGRANRSHAKLLFPTIASQLANLLPEIRHAIAAALSEDPLLCERYLTVQFEKLLLHPLQSSSRARALSAAVVIVIDALDECDSAESIKTTLLLLSQINAVTSIRLRIFVTSRPELPVELGFKTMSGDLHVDVRLEEAQLMSITHDIRLFYEHEFARMRQTSKLDFDPFPVDWPGEHIVQMLVDLAVPLFIFAFTVTRYISEYNTQERLHVMLRQSRDRSITGLKGTYLPILEQLVISEYERQSKERVDDFKEVVGPIILLGNPLSASSLSMLLAIPIEKIGSVLQPLHSVLNIPRAEDARLDRTAPITLFHLSFRDFLVDPDLKNENKFWIDEFQTHNKLAAQCIRLLSSGVLRKGVCGVRRPGTRRADIDKSRIQECLPDAVVYACSNWIHHVARSGEEVATDDGLVFHFLQKHLLHWMEAMSWLGMTAEVIHNLEALRSIIQGDRGARLLRLVDDGIRFILRNRAIVDEAPLQTYLSALLFTPRQSIIRQLFGSDLGRYFGTLPKVPERWSAERLNLEGHEGPVHAVAISANGKTVASGSWDQTVRVWSTATGEQMLKLNGHEGAVHAVAISADGKTVVSGSGDQMMGVWSTATGEQTLKLEGHEDPILTVAISVDGKTVASGSWDRTVRVWSTATGEQMMKFEGHEGDVLAVAISAKGETVASGSVDRTVRVWSTARGEQMLKLDGHDGAVHAVAISADGMTVMSGSGDRTVWVWSTATGEQTLKLEGHEGAVLAVAISADGKTMASGSWDRTVRVWSTATGEQMLKLEGHGGPVHAVAISADRNVVVSGSEDRTVRVWSTVTGEQTSKLEGHEDPINTIAISADGKTVASGSVDRMVRVWSTATGEQMLKLKGHDGDVLAVAISADGKTVASGSVDQTAQVWFTSTGEQMLKLIGHEGPVHTIAISADGKTVASGSWDRTVRVWSTATGEQMLKLEGHGDPVLAVAISAEGEMVASGSWDRTVRVWSTATGTQLKHFATLGILNRLRFTDEGTALDTSVGLFDLTLPSSSGHALPTSPSMDVIFNSPWVEYNGSDLLWLPHEYRGICSVTHGAFLAIGQASGAMSFFAFKKEGWQSESDSSEQ